MVQPAVLYRGVNIEQFDTTLAADGAVEAELCDVARMTEDFERSEAVTYVPEDIDDTTTYEEAPILGGFTANYGTGVHFSGSYNEYPVVTAIDNRESFGLTPITYSLNFMHDEPGVLCHIGTLSTGEVRRDGRVVGTLKDGHISDWGRQNMTSHATSAMYDTEAEYFTRERRLDISDHIIGSVSVAFLGATAPTPTGIARENGDLHGLSRRDVRRLNRTDGTAQELANALSEQVGPQIEDTTGEHYFVVTGDRFRLGKEQQQLTDEQTDNIAAVARNGSAVPAPTVPDVLLPR